MLVASLEFGPPCGLCFTLPMLFAVVIVGHAAYVVPARKDPVLCPRRRFAFWFACAGFALGSVTWWFNISPSCVPPHMIGLLSGAVVGRVVGWFVWAIWLNELPLSGLKLEDTE